MSVAASETTHLDAVLSALARYDTSSGNALAELTHHRCVWRCAATCGVPQWVVEANACVNTCTTRCLDEDGPPSAVDNSTFSLWSVLLGAALGIVFASTVLPMIVRYGARKRE